MDLHQHLLDRNYDVLYSGVPLFSTNTITFPLFSFSHKLVGYQQLHYTNK